MPLFALFSHRLALGVSELGAFRFLHPLVTLQSDTMKAFISLVRRGMLIRDLAERIVLALSNPAD